MYNIFKEFNRCNNLLIEWGYILVSCYIYYKYSKIRL